MSIVHVNDHGEYWEVWLDTEIAVCDGLCIGTGETRDAAVTEAVADLEAALTVLQQPPEETP